jgi:hypothetical protein
MAFRILSLDGGGTWALLQAMALQDLFPDMTGHGILAHFDLAVANSGGSIVLAGLMLDMSPARIRSLFEDGAKRRSIFHKKTWLEEELAMLPVFPRYATEEKRIGLHEVMGTLGNIPLAEWPNRPGWPTGPAGAPTRTLILAFNYDTLREDFLRSYELATTGAIADDAPLADAVNASTNAPVQYFDEPAVVGTRRYWDGAMGGYNNPLMAAVVDALALGTAAPEILALSLGTGTVQLIEADLATNDTPTDLVAPKNQPGLLANIRAAAGCILDDPPDAATYTAHIVLGHSPTEMGRVVRMSPVVRPVLQGGRWSYPPALSPEVFGSLTKLGMDAVEDNDVELIRALGTAWIHGGAPNQPIRMRTNLSAAPGDENYEAAKARWHRLIDDASKLKQ